MAVDEAVGDNARKGAVRMRSQLETKIMDEKHWSKRSKESGQFIDQKEKGEVQGRPVGDVISGQPGRGGAMTASWAR
jgi:hypothetical protein